MSNLGLPLSVVRDGLSRETDIRKSVSDFIRLLMTTPVGSCISEPGFGFLFNNVIFQNFNESEGIVGGQSGAAGRKISGNSKNLNTFAAELKESLERYEKRLGNISVSMVYAREERLIHVTVKGILVCNGEDYKYDTIIKVWS